MAITFTKKFENHPAGSFAAICCDVWEVEKPNPYKGTMDATTKKVDTRETVTKIRIKFITIDQDGKTNSVLYFGSKSWGENSKLRQFVRGWLPVMGKLDGSQVDLELLVGKTAWVTVADWDDGGGSSVVNATQLPPGINAPEIPANYVRTSEREQQA